MKATKDSLFISNDNEKQTLLIFCDGGARGNPGPAAVGFLLKDSSGKVLVKKRKFIGRATNNIAEYRAVIEALKWIKENKKNFHFPFSIFHFFLDSNLIVNQLNGLFKIKNSHLRNLIVEVRKQEREVGGNVFYSFIHREKNRDADQLVNQTLNQI